MRLRMTLRFVLALLVLAGGVRPSPAAEEGYLEVTAEELLESPQSYWAIGIIFRETILGEPGGREVRIGRARYTPLPAATLDQCYVISSDAERLREVIQPDTEYLCTGTVLQYRSRYYIIVQDLKPAVVNEGEAGQALKGLLSDPYSVVINPARQRANKILTDAEQALVAYMQAENLPDHRVLLDYASPHYEAALRVIRSSVADAEAEYETTARELLSLFVFATLAESAKEDRAEHTPPPDTEMVPAAPAPAPTPETGDGLDEMLSELQAAVDAEPAPPALQGNGHALIPTPFDKPSPSPAPAAEPVPPPPPSVPEEMAEPAPVAPEPPPEPAKPAAAKPRKRPAENDLNAPVAW